MKPILVTSGEPAGIGPDLCLALAGSDIPLVVYGDLQLLQARAIQLAKPIVFVPYQPGSAPTHKLNHLTVLSSACLKSAHPGVLNPDNAAYVIQMLTDAVARCQQQEFAALVTAPVHKGVLNDAGFAFTGHTEFLAGLCGVSQVVMLLASSALKMALLTTHVPLSKVPALITTERLLSVLRLLYQGLQRDFAITSPKIFVAGLNPHAGESGHLGDEEITIISPAIKILQQQGLDVIGPLPADTLFTPSYCQQADAFVAMYHDQGLPVLKYAAFGRAVNVTLGLPIVRTSVDHGTALSLAASGTADPGSLFSAIQMAQDIVARRT